jgi:hypothetical protein
MSIFIQPTVAPEPKSPLTEKIAMLLAGVFVLLAVGQLFSFEDFPAVIEAWHLPSVGAGVAVLLAAFVVVLEVLAIPFLLRMRLSPAMRLVSMSSGWLVGAWWLLVTLWQNTAGVAANVGLLGATVQLPAGWWAVFFVVAIGVLVAWASWGLWPVRRRVI